MAEPLSKDPTPDVAEHNAYFPSPYSLSQYTVAKTDFDGADYPTRYTGDKWKVLMLASDERYILMENGKMFSTGNHPVEMLLPMHHLDAAGFEIDVATLSGNPVKLEMWAMPGEDEAVRSTYQKYLAKLRSPSRLADLMVDVTAAYSPYIAVFVPGGHGVLACIPGSLEVKEFLRSFTQRDRFVVTLCHGPACLLAASVGEDDLALAAACGPCCGVQLAPLAVKAPSRLPVAPQRAAQCGHTPLRRGATQSSTGPLTAGGPYVAS